MARPKGIPQSDETKEKISKNNARFWLGKKRVFSDEWKGKQKARKRTVSEETKKKISESKKGSKFTEEQRKNMSLAHLGKPSPRKGKPGKKLTESQRRHLSEINKGEKSYLWKGGVTKINKQIRAGLEYRLWRESVFERDNYTCIWCGERGVMLNADHIKPFAYYPELRFAIDNGRTLCLPCHKTTDTYCKKQ